MFSNHCKSFLGRLPRNTAKEPGRRRMPRRGQAVIEYVLLVAVMTLIFGTLFARMRRSLYDLWVCNVAPRIQSPTGCGKQTEKCWQEIAEADGDLPPKCGVN